MPFLDVEGAAAYYSVACPAGADEAACPVILLHGAGGSHLDWPPALRRLAGRPVYAWDLPGHGRSAGPARTSIPALAQWAAAAAAQTGLASAVWLGHSMGAAIAWELAQRAPGLCAGVILIGAGVRFPLAGMLIEAWERSPETAARRWLELAYGGETMAATIEWGLARLLGTSPATIRADLQACAGFSAAGLAPAVPALLVAGEEDLLAPWHEARALQAKWPAARWLGLPGAGHMLALEQPAAVRAAVEAFLADLEPA